MIKFNCPQCGYGMKVPDSAAGKRGKCKKCGEVLRAPLTEVPEAIANPEPLPEIKVEQPAVSSRRRTRSKSRTTIIRVVGGAGALLLLVGLGWFLFKGQGSADNADPGSIVQSMFDSSPQELSTEQIVKNTEQSVAFIKGKFSSGTGFIVRPGIIVTNKHVLAEEFIDLLEVYFPSAADDAKGPFSAELIYQDPARDLAFMSINTKLPELKLAHQHSFRRGQDIIVIGNPGVGKDLILQNAVSRGVVSTQTEIEGREYHQLGISINSGNSGGPVLDNTGRVIGVVTLKANGQEGLGFSIPLDQLNTSLARMESRTPEQIAATRSLHRKYVVYRTVDVLSVAYLVIMELYTERMELAIAKGESAQSGLKEVQSSVKDRIAGMDDLLASTLKQDVAKIASDPNTPESIRADFAEYWSVFSEIRSYVDNPRGNFNSYSAKLRELADQRAKVSEKLGLLLGISERSD